MSFNYHRVIPRDLFNEAKLLKCLGFISLEYENKMFPEDVTFEFINDESEEFNSFNILMDLDGSIEVVNLELRKGDEKIRLYHPLNNKSSYPLRATYEDEDILVFGENGLFTKEFEELISEND